MIRKSVQRFSEEIMLKQKSMIRKSVQRFSLATNAGRVCAEIMLKQKSRNGMAIRRKVIPV
jgi:hypothetical protein